VVDIKSVETGETRTLFDELIAIRNSVAEEGQAKLAELTDGAVLPIEHRASANNLCQYLSLRHHDLRDLQRRLMCLGLSSIGRLESRVMWTLEAVIASLAVIDERSDVPRRPTEDEFFNGEQLLATAADELLGPGHGNRRGRIMVTLPTSAAEDPEFIDELARRGMDVARINCSHDDKDVWQAMASRVRDAGRKVDRRIPILMDIAGPKIRTELVAAKKKVKIKPGDLLRLVAAKDPYQTDEVPFCVSVSLPEIVTRVAVGERVLYDDGKLEGIVESLGESEALVRVKRTKAGGAKLKSEKGLNLPDTDLGLSPLTSKDHSDLAVVAANADIVGYSFISRPEDIDLLEEALANLPVRERALGLIAKIEQPQALTNVPALIIRARCLNRPFGIMIARGDLAAEIGFERVAEMQEELLWLCEAAAVPAIWAMGIFSRKRLRFVHYGLGRLAIFYRIRRIFKFCHSGHDHAERRHQAMIVHGRRQSMRSTTRSASSLLFQNSR